MWVDILDFGGTPFFFCFNPMNYPRCVAYIIDWAAGAVCPANAVAFIILVFDGNRYHIYKAWVELALWIEFFLMQVPCFFHFWFNGATDAFLGCTLFYIPRMTLWILTFSHFDTSFAAWTTPKSKLYKYKYKPTTAADFLQATPEGHEKLNDLLDLPSFAKNSEF